MADLKEPIDPEIFAELEREAPILARLTRFARGLEEQSWFDHFGEAPTKPLRKTAMAYLDQLGFPDAELAILPTWEDAADAAETYDWTSAAWDAEEMARADLTARALEAVSAEALQVGLSVIAQHVGFAAKEAMEQQAAYWDITDGSLRDLAVGAVAQAAHTAGLLLLAAAVDSEIQVDTHHVALKFRLFEMGRWPVAIVGGTFSLF